MGITPYVIYSGRLHPDDVALFERIRIAINQMVEPSLGTRGRDKDPIVLSCHILTRAVTVAFEELRVQDGYYAGSCEHSWLLTQHGDIIDVYPVGTLGGPIMVDGGMPTVLYRPAEPGMFPPSPDFSRGWFRKAVERTARSIRNTFGEYTPIVQ